MKKYVYMKRRDTKVLLPGEREKTDVGFGTVVETFGGLSGGFMELSRAKEFVATKIAALKVSIDSQKKSGKDLITKIKEQSEKDISTVEASTEAKVARASEDLKAYSSLFKSEKKKEEEVEPKEEEVEVKKVEKNSKKKGK